MILAQPHVMLAPVDDQQYGRRGGARVLQRVGHHRGDQLAPVADLAGGEQGQLGILRRPQLRRVGAGQTARTPGMARAALKSTVRTNPLGAAAWTG